MLKETIDIVVLLKNKLNFLLIWVHSVKIWMYMVEN